MTAVMPIQRWQIVGRRSMQIEDATFQEMKQRNKFKKKKSRDTLEKGREKARAREKEITKIKELREQFWPERVIETDDCFDLGLTKEEEEECEWFIQCIYRSD